MRVLAVASCLWLLTGATVGAGKIPVPMLNGRVNDAANVLSIEDQERLSKLLRDYEKETRHQIAVLIVPTLAGEAIESFCLRTAKAWRLGRKGIDDGIVVCMAINDRLVRIELGIGMNRYISNAEAKEIIDVEMTPSFAKGDFGGGLERGLKRLMEEGRRFVATEMPVPIALTVHISRTGECAVTKVTMPCGGVGAYVKTLNAQPGCDIHIEVNRESQYQFVASALGSLKKAGFWNVGFENNNN